MGLISDNIEWVKPSQSGISATHCGKGEPEFVRNCPRLFGDGDTKSCRGVPAG